MSPCGPVPRVDTGVKSTKHREALISCAASLAAAISLLERGGKAAKKAAPSDKMFDQMLTDYRKSLANAREVLSESSASQLEEDLHDSR